MDLEKHILIYEQRNELRQSFGPRRAFNFFYELFSKSEDLFTEINLTAIPEADSLERILTLPKLSHLRIVVTKPNSDDMTDEFASVMNRLGNQKARSLTLELQKAPKVDRLTPDDDTRALANVASTNGYVTGKERSGVVDSTKSHPKSVVVEVGKDGSSIVRFLSAFISFL